jgi:hypothetical protein
VFFLAYARKELDLFLAYAYARKELKLFGAARQPLRSGEKEKYLHVAKLSAKLRPLGIKWIST